MVVPYKQIILDQGLLVLYEQAMTSDTDPETSRPTLHVITSDGFYYIQIGGIIWCYRRGHTILYYQHKENLSIQRRKIYGNLDGFIDLTQFRWQPPLTWRIRTTATYRMLADDSKGRYLEDGLFTYSCS